MGLLTGIIIGVVIGAVIVLVIFGIIRRSKRPRPYERPNLSQSKQNDDDERTRTETYRNLLQKYYAATSRDEYVALQKEIGESQSKLSPSRYVELRDDAQNGIQRIDDIAKAQAEAEPKLAKFRALKNVTNNDQLFNELHSIYKGDSTIISYSDLEEYGEQNDNDWLNKTYDKLLLERFRHLLVVAQTGTTADYKKVTALYDELDEFYSTDDEDRDAFISAHLANEWNEVVVRFKRDVEWSDLYGLDDFNDNDFKRIIKLAREKGDVLNLQLVRLLSDSDDDFKIVLAEVILDELNAKLEQDYEDLGFKPGQRERVI